jgi:hypothetical protein
LRLADSCAASKRVWLCPNAPPEPKLERRKNVMSKAVLFRRHGKKRTDQAVSQVYEDRSQDPRTLARFAELLRLGRERSSLLTRPTVQGGRVLEIEALRNLASFDAAYIIPAHAWLGLRGSLICVVASLANHLFSRYPAPKFLASVWFGNDSQYSVEKRRWFAAHAAGARFRSLDLPMNMTRQMERRFLESPDHLSVEQAMRRAELLGLGASPELVDAVLATRLGHDLDNGDFWRSLMELLVRAASELELDDVGSIVDFLQFVRHEPIEIRTNLGVVFRSPPQPDFSLQGRTPASLLRLVDNWHRALGRARTANLSWEPSRYEPMALEDRLRDSDTPPVLWEFVELTNSGDLRLEGAALRHCVATYAYRCSRGQSRIWSLRRRTRNNRMRSIVTIEVDPRTNTVVEARGFRNSRPSRKALRLLQTWARKADLRIGV